MSGVSSVDTPIQRLVGRGRGGGLERKDLGGEKNPHLRTCVEVMRWRRKEYAGGNEGGIEDQGAETTSMVNFVLYTNINMTCKSM